MVIVQLTTDNREPFREYHKMEPWFGAAPEALLQGFAQLPEATVHVVSCTQKRMHSPEKLANNIWFHSLYVPKIGWMRTGYQGCIRAIRRKIGEIKPDIVHGQGTERECAISAVFSGFPNVVTIHGNMAELARLFHARIASYAWIAARLENLTLPRTSGVFCNSGYTRSLVHPRARKTWLVPNAVREAFFTTATSPASQKCTVLNVGVISPRKRQLELLDLARSLKSSGLDIQFEFIGHCDERDPYARTFLEQIRTVEQNSYARYLGTTDVTDLIRKMDASNALIHFPVEEAFGLVVAEAVARNLKVFASRVGGIIDIAAGIPSVELIDPHDWVALRREMVEWVGRGGPRSAAGQEDVRQQFHPKVIAERHVEIYREVLKTCS